MFLEEFGVIFRIYFSVLQWVIGVTRMPNQAATIKQSVLTRYAKALRAANVDRWRLIVRPDGEHEIIVESNDDHPTADNNDWD